nr:MAG TPA: hypothetical protein [Caudoviricetes sp.]
MCCITRKLNIGRTCQNRLWKNKYDKKNIY